MFYLLKKTLSTLILSSFIIFSFPVVALACTYEATITGNHVDFRITSDTNYIQLVQFMNQNNYPGATYAITKLYGPSPIAWTQYADGAQTYSGDSMIIQNRRQTADGAYWVSWINSGSYLHIPAGVYGMDFTGIMNYPDIWIMYGTMDEDGNVGTVGEPWKVCTRTGDVSGLPTETPSPTPSPSPSPTPTETPSPTPSPSPSPTPTDTPSPTPSPTPTPISVDKIFVVPGLGASWNLDAFLTCKNSGYIGDWTLAPFAKNVYKDLLVELENAGWNTFPFYYDWRQDVRTNEPLLSNFINSQTNSDEKVDVVGHSMGGMIGRNYLVNEEGGKASKFLAVGSPFKGSALSYPIYSGKEVWAGDIFEKIASTLLLEHCSVPSSIQNILPTEDYLKNSRSNTLKSVSSMNAKNNLYPDNFSAPFWGVKVGTLSGNGFSTLKNIKVTNPTRFDLRNGKWLDGVPVGQDNSNDGDGTVLVSSVNIDGAINKTINQSHAGLVSSTVGISEILNFFGAPGIADPPYLDPKSALILIGSPGNFWVTDKNGVVTQSENGMVALMDPESGNYQLQIVPTSTNTTFIVAQFMKDGDTHYKEYKFKGLTIEPKVIEFNSKNSKDDIVHDVREYKKPNFPRYWHPFWNFWNRFWRR